MIDGPHILLRALLQAYMRTGVISGVDLRKALGSDAEIVAQAIFPFPPAPAVRSGGEDMAKIKKGGGRAGGGIVIRPISFLLKRIAAENAAIPIEPRPSAAVIVLPVVRVDRGPDDDGGGGGRRVRRRRLTKEGIWNA